MTMTNAERCIKKTRLIDADKINFLWTPIAPLCISNDVHYEPVAFKWEIDAQPTIDALPVVHAHWHFDPAKPIGCGITVSGMFCSNCGGDCPTGRHPYRDFKYCPYCGARMDEGAENDND